MVLGDRTFIEVEALHDMEMLLNGEISSTVREETEEATLKGGSGKNRNA